jgi:hypothetical protein
VTRRKDGGWTWSIMDDFFTFHFSFLPASRLSVCAPTASRIGTMQRSSMARRAPALALLLVALVLCAFIGGVVAQSTAYTSAKTVQIYMMPEIMEGLLIGLLLIFFVAIGLYCTATIDAPDVLHSTTLDAGKEY